MKLLRRERLPEFARKHPDSKAPLNAWRQNMEANKFENFVGLKRLFGSADYVRPYVVFNIGGNKYRLIGLVDYELEMVSIEHVLTHAEYDRGRWRR